MIETNDSLMKMARIAPLTHWNRKYGLEIYNFPLPVKSCHHATKLCREICYGKQIWQNVIERYVRNYQFSQEPGFVDAVVAQVERRAVEWIRLHTIGDFYSQAYFDKWAEIAARCPGTRLLAYTRNHEIDVSAAPANLVLFYSVDPTTERVNPGIERRAFVFQPPAPRLYYQHMEPCDFYPAPVCVYKCSKCKYCFSGKGDIAFPLRRGRKNYAPPGDEYKYSWYLRRDGLYVPQGGLNNK